MAKNPSHGIPSEHAGAFVGRSLAAENSRRKIRARLFGGTPEPVMVGRYIVGDPVGCGATGTVYEGRDPQLDRAVAIKYIRTDDDPQRADAMRRRLEREAKSMAKLSHPNVAAVFEVGVADKDLFIAMEFATGGTLRRWLGAADRTWRDVLSAFVAAGRGLAAAHQAGIVHRDFKPDNVLFGEDGRVMVADFGIARILGEHEVGGNPSSAALEGGEPALTQTGAIVGTPLYMAPEQHAGRPTDQRTDQFGWCVALYESIYGQTPFAGDNIAEIALATRRGDVREPPSGSRVPAWLRRILLRGLSAEPDKRFPTMDDLLGKLERDRGARRRRVLVAFAIMVATAIGATGLWAGQQSSKLSACVDAHDLLAGVWDDSQRSAVRAAFEATGASYAAATFASLETELDRRAEAWASMHADVCEASQVRGDQSLRVHDARMQCLLRRRAELRAQVGTLARATEPTIVSSAHTALSKLPSLALCNDIDALLAAVPLPEDPSVLARVERATRRLDEADASIRAGTYPHALAVASEVASQTRELEYRPPYARALSIKAEAESLGGDAPGSVSTLYEATGVAAEAGDDERLAKVWLALLYQVVYVEEKTDQLQVLRHAAQAAVARSHSLALRIDLHTGLGVALGKAGEYDEAFTHLQRALQLTEAAPGPPDGLALGSAHARLGNAFKHKGKLDLARRSFERGLASISKSAGPDHPDVGMALNNLAIIDEMLGDFDLAIKEYQRAQSVFEKTLGPKHPHIAMTLNNLGNTLRQEGRYDEAVPLLKRAVEVFSQSRGVDHPHVAWPLNTLGLTYTLQGKPRLAFPLFERAIAIRSKRLGKDHPLVAMVEVSLGRAYLADHRARDAIAPLEHALSVRRAKKERAALLSITAYVLAQALWNGGGSRVRATKLAGEALSLARVAEGKSGEDLIKEVSAWLTAHRQ